jgi:hypothetical protein
LGIPRFFIALGGVWRGFAHWICPDHGKAPHPRKSVGIFGECCKLNCIGKTKALLPQTSRRRSFGKMRGMGMSIGYLAFGMMSGLTAAVWALVAGAGPGLALWAYAGVGMLALLGAALPGLPARTQT